MTGRGIDQILPHPSRPDIYESYLRDARAYVTLAEELNGTIPKPVDFNYIWGDALEELARFAPQVRIINLETSITTSDDYWPGKGINYRMHPDNIACLNSANIDCCTLANNHVLDWGYAGLSDTLATLKEAGIASVGAGQDNSQAQQPITFETASGARVLLFSFGSQSSGIPSAWAATDSKAGINLIAEGSAQWIGQLASIVPGMKKPGDTVVCSIHWGGNWGYEIPAIRRRVAHQLIDTAAVDIIHGHSSHHPVGIEVYRQKLILYGCGDFINDYEGIGSYEDFHGELCLMYFVCFNTEKSQLDKLTMVPLKMKGMQLVRPDKQDKA